MIRRSGSKSTRSHSVVAPQDSSKEHIGVRLRIAREAAGLSQGQAAGILGLHRPSVSESEAGRRKVSTDEVALYAKAYGVSITWLVGEEPLALDPRLQVAARELAKLKAEDLSRVLELLRVLGSGKRA
jgi:transcriptional regulator with XRE-family HTH domain